MIPWRTEAEGFYHIGASYMIKNVSYEKNRLDSRRF